VKLRITTPLEVVVDVDDIRPLRAEYASGSFGILPGHADFLTALTVSVVAWTDEAGNPHHCAVRHGVLSVDGGEEISVATRKAIVGDDLEALTRRAGALSGRSRRGAGRQCRERAAAARRHSPAYALSASVPDERRDVPMRILLSC